MLHTFYDFLSAFLYYSLRKFNQTHKYVFIRIDFDKK